MPTLVSCLDVLDWNVATDPDNHGIADGWFSAAPEHAKHTPIPWIIQAPFPGYHGVAWYHASFAAPDRGKRTLLRFWAVDYHATVWLNGQFIGCHEGAESPFVLDVTGAVADSNLLAVRVVSPCHEPIDGLLLSEIPHRNAAVPYRAGSAWAQGGIMDSVELLQAPVVRLADVFVQADLDGRVRVALEVDNAGRATRGRIELTVAPAHGGETVAVGTQRSSFRKGTSVVEAELRVPDPRRWELAEPNLYRLTARLRIGEEWDELSTRFGFRDFRFERGHFRLNGKRLYLKCSHTGNSCPVGLELPVDPDWLRRDLVNVKAMGFNAIRFIAGVAKRYQLDLCDELGLMVYEESYAGWCLGDSPRMAERYDESVLGMIRRDRNHPCITIWGLLNETPNGLVFQHALATLPKVRQLDPTRLVILNSGDWHSKADAKPGTRPGSLSNPGGTEWEDVLSDQHPYQPEPQTAEVVNRLRNLDGGERPVFVSEYGIGSAVDLWRVTRWYELLG
ncbi:MAG: hypothetical protein HYU66_24070, partial [Armatimonadetes bacterium]|nr:hypothetical protein [Armatimonadota bacterium]